MLLYALQTASGNLRSTKFEPRPEQVVIDRSGVLDTSLGDDAWYKEEFDDDEDEAEPEEEAEPEVVEQKPKKNGRANSRKPPASAGPTAEDVNLLLRAMRN